MAKKSLTTRQREILDFIIESTEEIGYPPSIKEIAVYFGFRSLTTVSDHIKALIRKGFIHKDKGARKLIVDSEYKQATSATQDRYEKIPLVGDIAAGTPILAAENIEESFLIDKKLVDSGKTFLLKVHGNSMIDAHIKDGDLIAVKQQNHAEHGDIVAAIIGNEATVKRFVKDNDKIFLKPENASMEPMDISKFTEPVRIAGKVVGVFRTLS